jgi:diketogulonate reductase-like aldo/keto reductase
MLLWTSLLLLVGGGLNFAYSNDNNSDDHLLTFQLNNGFHIPLVGMGIGNLQHELIPQVVSANLMPSQDIRLIDTAHNSNNEEILGQAVAKFDGASHHGTRGSIDNPPPLHVVTKVWYTYLGYERTKIAVAESLSKLASANTRQVYVHMLLHWPRCNDNIEWMNCEQEENNLPQYVKDAGAPPHLDKDNAWKDSWRALEGIYAEHSTERQRTDGAIGKPIIASIGVSNFELDDMKALIELSNVRPQMYQGNSWAIFHDPYLMNLLRDHNIFFQSYGVMFGIIQRRQSSPSAYHILSSLSHELTETIHSASNSEDGTKQPVITEATVLLAYLIHSNIGIIPRAAATTHQQENSPSSIKAVVEHLTPNHIEKLERAIPALMKGEQLHSSVSFMNTLESAILIHWLNPNTNEEVPVSNLIHPGKVEVQQTHPGHRFVAYDAEKKIRKEFLVEAGYGEEQFFQVEL